MSRRLVACALAVASAACGATATPPPTVEPVPSSPAVPPSAPSPFEADVAFLRQHTEVVVLAEAGGDGRVAVVPAYQGRVMTSTAGGEAGASFGWIHRANVAAGVRQPHMTVLGGEDRFWLGPEGGQYALYFAPGEPFDLDHWQVPEAIDWGAWPVAERAVDAVSFRKDMVLRNYAGTELSLTVERTVRVLPASTLEVPPPAGVRVVCFASENRILNTGDRPWTKEGGLVSIWILGMFNPSASTTVAIPFVRGDESTLGPILQDAYFGPVPPDRLAVEDGLIRFKGDGQARGKIGVPRPRAVPRLGSYDAEGGVLTVVTYTLPEGAVDYVSSMWEHQEAPFRGDVVNSYNDGPPAPGKPPLGPFYELETSSPAAALAPGESLAHRHQTCHFEGPAEALDRLAQPLLGATVDQIARPIGR